MSKYLYHYTGDENQKSIISSQSIYLREINNFNIKNEKLELNINQYYRYTVKVLKDNYQNSAFIKDLPSSFDESLKKKIHTVKYDFIDTYHDNNIVPFFTKCKSKIYVGCFSKNPNSVDMYNEFNNGSKHILKIDKDKFKSIIFDIVYNEFKNYLDSHANIDKQNYTKLGKNILCEFEDAIGLSLIDYNKVMYLTNDKNHSILHEIKLKHYLDEILDHTNIKRNIELLMKIIYINSHKFKEYNHAFQEEIRLLLILPEFIAYKFRVRKKRVDFITNKLHVDKEEEDLVCFPIKEHMKLNSKDIITKIEFEY